MKILSFRSCNAEPNRSWSCYMTSIALCLTLMYEGISAQTPSDVSGVSALKRLSVEELMNIEVTSVSKRLKATINK